MLPVASPPNVVGLIVPLLPAGPPEPGLCAVPVRVTTSLMGWPKSAVRCVRRQRRLNRSNGEALPRAGNRSRAHSAVVARELSAEAVPSGRGHRHIWREVRPSVDGVTRRRRRRCRWCRRTAACSPCAVGPQMCHESVPLNELMPLTVRTVLSLTPTSGTAGSAGMADAGGSVWSFASTGVRHRRRAALTEHAAGVVEQRRGRGCRGARVGDERVEARR